MSWVGALQQLSRTEEALVIVTVCGTRGSTPRETGARMIVSKRSSYGTIGGGQLEYECLAIAGQWLKNRSTPKSFSRRITLGANCGQCCGGVVDILFEQLETDQSPWLQELEHLQGRPAVLMTAIESHSGLEKRLLCIENIGANDALGQTAIRLHEAGELPCRRSITLSDNVQIPVFFEAVHSSLFEIAIYGAGHVGSALVAGLAAIDCQIHWIDSREDIFPSVVPANTHIYNVPDPQSMVDQLGAGQYSVVMTHSHSLDLEICARILQRDDSPYCGLIGSRAKKHQFIKRLKGLGLSEQQLSKLICPIGINGIDGKQPAEIAIAVSAQLLQLREQVQNTKSASGLKAGRMHR